MNQGEDGGRRDLQNDNQQDRHLLGVHLANAAHRVEQEGRPQHSGLPSGYATVWGFDRHRDMSLSDRTVIARRKRQGPAGCFASPALEATGLTAFDSNVAVDDRRIGHSIGAVADSSPREISTPPASG